MSPIGRQVHAFSAATGESCPAGMATCPAIEFIKPKQRHAGAITVHQPGKAAQAVCTDLIAHTGAAARPAVFHVGRCVHAGPLSATGVPLRAPVAARPAVVLVRLELHAVSTAARVVFFTGGSAYAM